MFITIRFKNDLSTKKNKNTLMNEKVTGSLDRKFISSKPKWRRPWCNGYVVSFQSFYIRTLMRRLQGISFIGLIYMLAYAIKRYASVNVLPLINSLKIIGQYVMMASPPSVPRPPPVSV